METHIEAELHGLRDKLIVMAGHAKAAVNDAVQALSSRDGELARRVVENDRILDEIEMEIDDFVIQHLTKAPLATDLRLVTQAMKISQNLERIGDEATKIARRSHDLHKEPLVNAKIELPRMAELAMDMLADAVNAFNNRDSALARSVLPRDKEVDRLNKQNQRTLTQQMIDNPASIDSFLRLIDASKSLERIADHATNIAEDVVYLCQAEDIRHSGAKDAPLST
ncbi:MAG TPA: phosphate signaling complex protein PhoU [Verrucomicrobiae bacterium]|jgi:phosphate transport system protein